MSPHTQLTEPSLSPHVQLTEASRQEREGKGIGREREGKQGSSKHAFVGLVDARDRDEMHAEVRP